MGYYEQNLDVTYQTVLFRTAHQYRRDLRYVRHIAQRGQRGAHACASGNDAGCCAERHYIAYATRPGSRSRCHHTHKSADGMVWDGEVEL